MPDANFPNFSKVVVCLQMKLVQAATLESAILVQMVRAALVHTMQTNADVSCSA